MKKRFSLNKKDLVLLVSFLIILISSILLKYLNIFDLSIEIISLLIFLFALAYLSTLRKQNQIIETSFHKLNLNIDEKYSLINSKLIENKNHLIETLADNFEKIIMKIAALEKIVNDIQTSQINSSIILNNLDKKTNEIQSENKSLLSLLNELKSEIINKFKEVPKIENIQIVINKLENINQTNVQNINIIKEINNNTLNVYKEFNEKTLIVLDENRKLLNTQHNDLESKISALAHQEQLNSSLEKIGNMFLEVTEKNSNHFNLLKNQLVLVKDESNNQLSNIKTFLDKLSKSEEVDAKLLSLNNSIVEKAHFNADKTQEAIKILENFSQTQIDYSNLMKQKLSEIIEQAIQSSANQNNIKSSLIKYEENSVELFNSLTTALTEYKQSLSTDLQSNTSGLKEHFNSLLEKDLKPYLSESNNKSKSEINNQIEGLIRRLSESNDEIKVQIESSFEKDLKPYFAESTDKSKSEINNQIQELIRKLSESNEEIRKQINSSVENSNSEIIETIESKAAENNNKTISEIGKLIKGSDSSRQIENQKVNDFLVNKLIEIINNRFSEIDQIIKSAAETSVETSAKIENRIVEEKKTLIETLIDESNNLKANLIKNSSEIGDKIERKITTEKNNLSEIISKESRNINTNLNNNAALKDFIEKLSKVIDNSNQTLLAEVNKYSEKLSVNEVSKINYNTNTQLTALYKQIDALNGIYSFLDNLRHPLPIMRGWPASPDFILRLINIIYDKKPKTILDVGSGVTSLVAAYCLEKIGGGKVVSLEHDKKFFDITSDNIKKHKLEDYIDLQYSPLKDYKINGKDWKWYDNKFLNNNKNFDIVIVDGPPGAVQELSRYPAIPILSNKISKNSIILLDDGKRPDEKKIVELWLKENKDLNQTFFHEDEKGTFVIISK